jgi:hypothetical protein
MSDTIDEKVVEELSREMVTRREEKPKTNNVYKAQADKHKKTELSSTIAEGSIQLSSALSRPKLAIDDSEGIRKRTEEYLVACQRTGTLPTVEGLSRAYGISRKRLYNWFDSPQQGEYLELVRDLFSEILQSEALKNNLSAPVSIFIMKNRFEMSDTLTIQPLPTATPLGDTSDPTTINQKYANALPPAMIDFKE